MFHYGSIRLIVEPCRSAHLKAMEVAKEAGALLSYDPNLREPLWPSKEEAKTQITSIWEKAEIIKVWNGVARERGDCRRDSSVEERS